MKWGLILASVFFTYGINAKEYTKTYIGPDGSKTSKYYYKKIKVDGQIKTIKVRRKLKKVSKKKNGRKRIYTKTVRRTRKTRSKSDSLSSKSAAVKKKYAINPTLDSISKDAKLDKEFKLDVRSTIGTRSGLGDEGTTNVPMELAITHKGKSLSTRLYMQATYDSENEDRQFQPGDGYLQFSGLNKDLGNNWSFGTALRIGIPFSERSRDDKSLITYGRIAPSFSWAPNSVFSLMYSPRYRHFIHQYETAKSSGASNPVGQFANLGILGLTPNKYVGFEAVFEHSTTWSNNSNVSGSSFYNEESIYFNFSKNVSLWFTLENSNDISSFSIKEKGGDPYNDLAERENNFTLFDSETSSVWARVQVTF